MSKFDGLITNEDQELIESIFSEIEAEEKDIINITESIENIVYLHPSFFGRMKRTQRLNCYITLATAIDTFLDEEINPLARQYALKMFNAFNNNILEVVKGGHSHVQ